MNFYKFRVVNTNSLSALANNKLWFSNLNGFNDPFEGEYVPDNNLPDTIVDRFIVKNKMSQTTTKILSKMGIEEGQLTDSEILKISAEYDLKNLVKIVQDSKVICFSLRENQNDPIKENLMWSHYADGLRGFCMVFDYDRLLESLQKSIEQGIRPIRVKYQNKPSVLKLSDFLESDFVLDQSNDNFVTLVTETIATKSTEWQYENEFRIITLNKKTFHTYSSESLLEIVIGDKMPMDLKMLVINTAKRANPNIAIKKANLISNTYQLEIVDFDVNNLKNSI